MIEIIALIFLARQIGALAYRKGLKPGWWKFYLVIAWIAAEFVGLILGTAMFDTNDIFTLMPFALVCAFGGYLIVRAILLKKPDGMDDEIEQIGNN